MSRFNGSGIGAAAMPPLWSTRLPGYGVVASRGTGPAAQIGVDQNQAAKTRGEITAMMMVVLEALCATSETRDAHTDW